MYTRSWEQAQVQTCYLAHLTTLTGRGYRRGLIAPRPKAGALGRGAHRPEKTTITCFSKEASTVCPWGPKRERDHSTQCSKWPRCSHLSQGRRGKVKPAGDTLSTGVRVLQGSDRPHSVERGVYSFPVTHLLPLMGKRGHLASFTLHR